MTRLFRRNATLRVTSLDPDSFDGERPNSVLIRNLRIAFNIQLNIHAVSLNNCSATVWNLSPDSRELFQRTPTRVTLEAGFDGEFSRLFRGNVSYSTTKRAGSDWETNFLLTDGGRRKRYSRIQRTYKAGTTKRDMLRDVAGAMGLTIPTNIDEFSRLRERIESGFTLSGPSSKEMDKLLASVGVTNWSIQDQTLQVLRDDQVLAGQAIVIEEQTGMIGGPELGPPPAPGIPSNLLFTTLLDTRIRPGVRLQVTSKFVSGQFSVWKATHQGDTHGGQWTTSVEARKASF